MDERKACEGADTIENRDSCEEMRECIACGSRVRHDLTEHPFFGFSASCPNAKDLKP
jgi:hypothetical protein